MSKKLKVIFFILIAINMIMFGVYFWRSKLVSPLGNKNNNNDLKELAEQTSSSESDSPRIYIEKPLFRTIQAIFVSVSSDKLYYKNRNEGSDTIEAVTIDNLILYICMPPTLSLEIGLDENNTGYRDFLNSEELNMALFESDPIAIATILDEFDQEKVNYIIAAKCLGVNEE